MKFYQASTPKPKLPRALVKALNIDDSIVTIVDPDNIWRHAHEFQESTTFFLAKPKRKTEWLAFTETGELDHGNIPQYRAIARLTKYEIPYSIIFIGRTGRIGDNTLVTFWDPRFTIQDVGGADDREIIELALPVLKAKGIVSPKSKLWVFGYEGNLIQAPPVVAKQPKQTPQVWHDQSPGQKSQYSIGGQTYSYMDFARALHTLPKESQEFQAIASFLRGSNAPELAGLRARLPREQKPAREYFKNFDLYKPENLEHLGSQSRIDKYWDARVGSRRFRIARVLVKKVSSNVT